MGRLISLKLQASSTKIWSLPPPSPPPNRPLPPIPPISPKHSKPDMSSPHFPCTQNDGRQVLDEVKILYLTKQYEQCSARCIHILENATEAVHPLHSIYLEFYAAICLELRARPLPNSSTEKMVLFELARVHYQIAKNRIWAANLECSPLIRQISNENHERLASSSSEISTASSRSSVSSVTDSIFSYTFSSPSPSPTSSIFSFYSSSKQQDESSVSNPLKPRPLRIKKKVCFQPTLPTVISSADISSDSGPVTTEASHSQFYTSSSLSLGSFTVLTPVCDRTVPNTNTLPSFLLSCSLARYKTHLASLSDQITYHISTLNSLISSIEAQEHQKTPSNPQTKSISHPERKNRHLNLPLIFDSLGFHGVGLLEDLEIEREEKARARRARIEELKLRGEEWKSGKGRFDYGRYEVLCEEALRELGPGK